MKKIYPPLTSTELKQIKRGPMSWVKPMLSHTPKYYVQFDRHWIFEPKLDGYRALVYRQQGRVQIWSRNKRNLSDYFPELLKAFERIQSHDFILDGEIVAIQDKNKSQKYPSGHFETLQTYLGFSPFTHVPSKISIRFYVFDLIYLDGYYLSALPWVKRRAILRSTFRFRHPIHLNSYYKNQRIILHRAIQCNWEGIIAKNSLSPYQFGRSQDWIKIKQHHAQEFVIGGYTAPKGNRTGLGSLLIGYYQGNKFKYAGKVGSGYSQTILEQLYLKLQPFIIKQTPFSESFKSSNITWVKPKWVAEIHFTEWTRDGRLRHPRFLGLRKDKSPKSVIRESL